MARTMSTHLTRINRVYFLSSQSRGALRTTARAMVRARFKLSRYFCIYRIHLRPRAIVLYEDEVAAVKVDYNP